MLSNVPCVKYVGPGHRRYIDPELDKYNDQARKLDPENRGPKMETDPAQ